MLQKERIDFFRKLKNKTKNNTFRKIRNIYLGFSKEVNLVRSVRITERNVNQSTTKKNNHGIKVALYVYI